MLRRLLPLLLLTVGCAVRQPPATICFDCFWKYQPQGFKQELLDFYRSYDPHDPLASAERDFLVARVSDDPKALCRAREAFAALKESAPARRLLVAETLAFTARDCGEKPDWEAAAEAADDPWKASVYREMARGSFRPKFGEAELDTHLVAPEGTRRFVLGASSIRVTAGEKVVSQVERVARDWLSYQLKWDLVSSPPKGGFVPWHEGARLTDLSSEVAVDVIPAEGVLAAYRDGHWYAPDEKGVFRFQVLDDKVQYPTTRFSGNLALLVDTHGISSLVEAARREGAGLVVGCGDHPEKMKAALALARDGVDVWFPCDRYVGTVLGYDAPGVLLGSAPVRKEGDVAVIGDTPVAFDVSETIVVEDATPRGNLRYYDAPARYFRRLAEVLPLKLEIVEVEASGESSKVIARAEATGASAIALRVQTDEDAAPVRAWLSGSKARRAVLFHTAPYPAGYALFGEFPGQTTFGDPKPRFER